MKKLMTEWRKYIKESKESSSIVKDDVLNENVTSAVMASTEIAALLGDVSIRAVEGDLISAFIKAGASDISAKQYVNAIKFAIVEAIPNVIDLAAASKPTLTKYIVGTLSNLVSKAPALLPILKGLGRLSVPIAIIGAIKDIYDIQQAWSAYAQTVGLSNVKATNRLGQLREIEERIKKEGFESVRASEANTALKRMDIFRYFVDAKTFYPNVVEMFPSVFNLLDNGLKKSV